MKRASKNIKRNYLFIGIGEIKKKRRESERIKNDERWKNK